MANYITAGPAPSKEIGPKKKMTFPWNHKLVVKEDRARRVSKTKGHLEKCALGLTLGGLLVDTARGIDIKMD